MFPKSEIFFCYLVVLKKIQNANIGWNLNVEEEERPFQFGTTWQSIKEVSEESKLQVMHKTRAAKNKQ